MKLIGSTAPHIRTRDTSQFVMLDVMGALLPIYFMAAYYYGMRAVVLGLISMLTCALAQGAAAIFSGRGSVNFRDYSPLVTGMLLPLMMPASVDFRILISAGLFAILVVKAPFGGTGENIFNPAAGGFAFAAICWPQAMFSYPPVQSSQPAFALATEGLGHSAAYALQMDGRPGVDLLDMLLGNFIGPMGATNILVILACLVYLIARSTVDWRLSGSFLATAALMAFLFPRAGLGRGASVGYEMMSGMLLFAAVFLITDPVTSPKRSSSKVFYGAAAGVVIMLFRRFGGFEDSCVFAILLLNAFVYPIDRLNERLHSRKRRKILETGQV